jgi:hypothetical protein
MPGSHFSTLIEAGDAESHDWNFLAQSSALAYSPRGWKYLNSVETQTDENQIRTVKTGLQDRLLFISGCTHLVTAGGEQSFYPVACLFHIFNHKDDRTPFSIRYHGLLYKWTLFS